MKRSVFSTSALTLFLGTVPLLPLGIINSLFNIGPIVIHFLEAIYHKKHLHKTHFTLTLSCFIGVLLIIKPGFLFGQTHSWPIIFLILPVIGAFCNAFSMFILHELKGKVSNLITLQYFYITQTFITGLLQNFEEFELKKELDIYFLLSVFGLVFFAYLTQNLITRAIYIKKASYIMPFGYIGIVVAFVFDLIFYDISFDWLSILGMILTSTSLLSKLLIKE